jgi:hypothetical protein
LLSQPIQDCVGVAGLGEATKQMEWRKANFAARHVGDHLGELSGCGAIVDRDHKDPITSAKRCTQDQRDRCKQPPHRIAEYLLPISRVRRNKRPPKIEIFGGRR